MSAASATWRRLRRVDTLVVHLLEERQHAIASRFATRDVDRFAPPTSWARLSTGEPLLTEVGTWMRCALERRVDLGDHVLVAAGLNRRPRGRGGSGGVPAGTSPGCAPSTRW